MGLWGRTFRVEGIILIPSFCTWETQKIIYIYFFFFATYSCHFSSSDQSHIQNKQPTLSDNTSMTHYFRGREISKNLGAQCWHYMWWIMAWMFRFIFRFFWAILPGTSWRSESSDCWSWSSDFSSDSLCLLCVPWQKLSKDACLFSHDSLSTS